jgi:aspartyl-tRNA synthetase
MRITTSWPTFWAACARSWDLRLGLADQNVLAYCWVYHFPMYQWDPERSRWDATHNPFSGVCPRTRSCSSPNPEIRTGRRTRIRPAGPGDAVRRRPQRLGAGRRVGSNPQARTAGAQLCAAGLLAGTDARTLRRHPGGLRLRRAAARRHRHGDRSLGGAASHQTNIREVMAFPKTQSGADPDAGAPSEPDPEQYSELGLRFVGVQPSSATVKPQ